MNTNNPKFIVVHCTDYSYANLYDQFSACNGWHKDRAFPLSSLGYYVGYHRLITGNTNYRARLDTDEGAHCNNIVDGLSMNFQSLGVCIGFDGDIEMPLTLHMNLLKEQIQEWMKTYNIPIERVQFHRDFSTVKTCPGSLITRQWLENLINPIVTSSTCLEENVVLKAENSKLKLLLDNLKVFLSTYFK